MPLSEEDKLRIKPLRYEKHYNAEYLLRKFPNRNWTDWRN